MTKLTALPAAIKAIREAKAENNPAFRGSQFATACLMSHAHLSNIEAGRKRPPSEVIARIALALGVPVDAISYETPLAMEATG